MTVHTICDNCGMEYVGAGVTIGDNIYCCAGCAQGGPCTCGAAGTVAGSGDTVIYDEDAVVVTEGDTVIAPSGSTTIIR